MSRHKGDDMIMKEIELYPETVGDLKAALAGCPDDMPIYDACHDTIKLTLQTEGEEVFIEVM